MRRCLAAVLALLVTGSAPAHAQAPSASDEVRGLHQRAREFLELGQHLEAARSWLRALEIIAPTPEEAERVKSLYCQAMQSLDVAASEHGQAAQVRVEIDARRERLEQDAELLRRHARSTEDIAPCLAQWQRLSQRPSDATTPPPTVDDDVDPPPPAQTQPTERRRVHRGFAAGVGVSAGLMGVSAVLLGVGFNKMKTSEDDAQVAADAAVADGATLETKQSLCTADGPTLPGDALESACEAHGQARAISFAGLAGLGVSTVATVVFAVLLARSRRAADPPKASAYVTPTLAGGVMVGGVWRF